MSVQDQYVAIAKQGQEAAAAVAEAWTRSFQETASKFQETAGKLPAVPGADTAHQMIDQVFDFAQTVADVQRNLAKQLVTASAKVAEEATAAAE